MLQHTVPGLYVLGGACISTSVTAVLRAGGAAPRIFFQVAQRYGTGALLFLCCEAPRLRSSVLLFNNTKPY